MPTAFDQAVREMCGDAVSQAVAALAEKYSFDVEEAMRELNLSELKLVRKRGPSPKKETEKSVTKKAKKEDKPKTKRPPTGYLLYAADVRSAVKEELTEALEEGEKLKPQATVTEIARRWKALSEEERGKWTTQAKADAAGQEEDGE